MISLVVILLLQLINITYGIYEIKHFTFQPPYKSYNWRTFGRTAINNDGVYLTTDTPSTHGGIVSIRAMHKKNWEARFVFRVYGANNLFGDGFAFWYAKTLGEPGPAFGSPSSFSGLGIFFDTYANQNGEHKHEHPYISAMVNDGSKQYDHDRDGTLTELAGCSTNFRNHEFAYGIISYVDDTLSLKIKYKESDDVINCFKVNGVRLPTGYYFGFSAATGELSDNHVIESIGIYEADEINKQDDYMDYSKVIPSVDHEAPMRERVNDEPPRASWFSRVFWSLIYLLLFCGTVGLIGYFGYKYYTKRQRQSKRFY